MFTTFETAKNSYRCKLTTRALIDIEKELGDNPLNIFMELTDGGKILLEPMVAIVFHSMTAMNHGISRKDVYSIIDDFFDSGKGLKDLLSFIVDLFKDSGLLNGIEEEETEGEQSNPN